MKRELHANLLIKIIKKYKWCEHSLIIEKVIYVNWDGEYCPINEESNMFFSFIFFCFRPIDFYSTSLEHITFFNLVSLIC